MALDPQRGGIALISVTPGIVNGIVSVPGSKSFTHRTYVLAAQSDRPCTIVNPLRAADPDATLAALHHLGAQMEVGPRHVSFVPAALKAPATVLDLQTAGTGLRLVTALAARLAAPVALTGDASLRQRPNGPLLDALRALGAHVEARDGRAPYTVRGPIRPGHVTLPAAISSQYASALLLSLPMLEGPSRLILTRPVHSRPYLDITRQCMDAFALRTEGDDDLTIPGAQVPRCPRFEVPADWSTAAFPLAAAAITGGTVTAQGPRPDDLQGDRRILELLASFGAIVDAATNTVSGAPLTSPGTIDIAATPDLFPVLCAVAAVATGTTTFVGGAALRHKETDRIHAMAVGLGRMGIQCLETPDGLVIEGGKPQGAEVDAFDDHRIHMAFYVLGLAAAGETRITHPECVRISYPGFHDDMAALRGAQ